MAAGSALAQCTQAPRGSPRRRRARWLSRGASRSLRLHREDAAAPARTASARAANRSPLSTSLQRGVYVQLRRSTPQRNSPICKRSHTLVVFFREAPAADDVARVLERALALGPPADNVREASG
eukprot:8355258-Pyramimonas_sp.AAC.1